MITQEHLNQELSLAKRIFLEYTNRYLRTRSLSLMEEEQVWMGCVELEAALQVLKAMHQEEGVWYSGGLAVTEEYYMRVIYIIHEYQGQGITNDELRLYVPSSGEGGSSGGSSSSASYDGIREGRCDNMPGGTYRILFSNPFQDKRFNNHVQIVQDGMDIFNGYITPGDDPLDLSGFEVTVPAGSLATIYYSAIKFQ